MFIFSTKVTRGKLLTIALVCACLAIILIVSIPSEDVDAAKKTSLKGKSNEQRIEFLETFGWTVDETPIESVEIVIPTEFDETYENYNSMQLSQGFDLVGYKGKTAVRYSYNVTNYPSNHKDPIYATLIVVNDKIVAGDIASTALGGFMHTLVMPKESTNTNTQTAEDLLPSASEILAGIIDSSGK